MNIYNNTYCVYAHINKVDGKIYVGTTKYGDNPNKRWKNGNGYLDRNQSGTYKQPHFAYAILKYGWDNFAHEIIVSNLTKEEADNFEKILVDKLKLQDSRFGYNIRSGGGSNGSLSDETRKKISKSNKGKIFSEKHKLLLSKASKGAKQSKETIEKRVEKLRGKKRSEEYKKYMSERTKQSMTQERIDKLIERNRIRWSDPNERLKQGEIARRTRSKPVFCVELNKIFPSAKEAGRTTGVSDSNISMCCCGKRASAGKHPITCEKLHWISEGSDPILFNKYHDIFEAYEKEVEPI